MTKDLFDQIRALLLPEMGDTNARRALVESALFGSPVLDNIDWNGAAYPYTVLLLTKLIKFGPLSSGKPAIAALLEEVRSQVGLDRQGQIDHLLVDLSQQGALELPYSNQDDVAHGTFTDRSINLKGDATNSTFISGDGNSITVNNYPSLPPEPKNSRAIATLSAELDEISLHISVEYRAKLAQVHEKYREGKVRDALNELLAIQEGGLWKTLNPDVQAQILRNIARYEFELTGDIDKAGALVTQAKTVDPNSDDTLIRVMLRNAEAGPEAALHELGIPNDTIKFNLQLSLLLQADKVDDLLALANLPPQGITPDVETLRFQALAFMAKGELSKARTLMEDVLAQSSPAEMVQHTMAMIEYWSSISPSVRFPRLTSSPAPLGLIGVKSDLNSLGFLRQAEARFAQLARETQRGDEQRQMFEAWRLACLANDFSRLHEAQKYCQQLVSNDPTHHRAVLWAIVHNFEVDFQSAVIALEASFETQETDGQSFDLGLTLTLLSLYLKLKKAEKADALLERTKEQFAAADASEVQSYWSLRTALARNDYAAARVIITQTDHHEMRLHLETMLLRVEAQKSGDFQAFVTHLEACLADSAESEYLFELCDLRANQGDWAYVAGHAKRLIAAFDTAAAVYLATGALWHNKQFGDCLEMMETYESYFPEQHLPDDLWRIKVYCLLEKGRLNEAVETARALAQHANSAANQQVLLDAYFRQGDLLNLAATAQEIAHRDDVHPEALVKTARLAALQDQALARKLLRKAIPYVNEHPELLGVVIQTGFELNIEDETGHLFRKLSTQVSIEKTGVTFIEAKDFPAMLQQIAKGNQQADELYARGEIPLHLYAERFKVTLAYLLHELPQRNQRNIHPRRKVPIFVRHGSRSLDEQLFADAANWRLYLDITALLLAESLGILDEVEKTFGYLYISSSTQHALAMQLDQLHHQQPSRLAAYRLMLRLLEEKRIQVFPDELSDNAPKTEEDERLGAGLVAQMKKAREENAYVVAFLPITTLEQERIEFPAEYASHVINSRALIDSLKTNHIFDESEYEAASKRLGSSGNAVEGITIPPLRATIYLNGILAETLASAELLDDLSQHFTIFADPQDIQQARLNLEQDNEREQLKQWLRQLIGRVREGLGSGIYQPIQCPDPSPTGMAEEEAPRPELKCLRDLFFFQSQSGDVIWADDRFLSRYQTRDHVVPIIGINEVLAALKERGTLSEEGYNEKLHKLRSGNYKYIPITKDEILYQLRRAKLNEQGTVIETRELAVLRQYTAACLLDKGCLQLPPMPAGSPNPSGETNFILGLNQAVREAIDAIWADQRLSVAEARWRADWLLDNLFTGLHGALHLRREPIMSTVLRELAGNEVAIQFLATFQLDLKSPSPRERLRRKACLTWLWQRLVAPRCQADPEIIEVINRALQQTITEYANKRVRPKQEARFTQFLLREWYLDVLESCENKFSLPTPICHQIGVDNISIIKTGSLRFNADIFRKAVEKAGRKGIAQLKDFDTEETYTIVPAKTKAAMEAFEIHNSANEVVGALDSLWQLVSPDKAARERLLRKHRDWFDCGQEEFEQTIRQLNRAGAFASRLQQAEQWRNESAEFYYRKLESEWSREYAFTWEELLPPSAEGLLRHFRLNQSHASGVPFAEAWPQAVSMILAEEELEVALERLACLPVKMPATVATALKVLPSEQRYELLKRCQMRWGAPVNQLHLIDLSLRCADGNTDILALASEIAERLFDDKFGEEQFELFGDVLRFVDEIFSQRYEVSEWQTGYKLALIWAHASRLYNIFSRQALFPNFTSRQAQVVSMLFAPDLTQKNDILHPQHLKRTIFLTHGLTSLVGDVEPQLTGIIAKLESKFFQDVAGIRFPDFSLFADPLLATNLTGSFLGGNRAEALRSISGEENLQLLDSTQLQEWVNDTLNELKQDVQADHSWAKLWLVVGELPFYPAISDKLIALLRVVDLVALYQVKPSVVLMAFRFLVGQCLFIQDSELRLQLEEQVIKIAHLAAKKYARSQNPPDDKEQAEAENLANLLARCAINLTVGEDEGNFCGGKRPLPLQRLFEAWPEHYSDAQNGFWQILRGLSVQESWKAWPAYLALRAMR